MSTEIHCACGNIQVIFFVEIFSYDLKGFVFQGISALIEKLCLEFYPMASNFLYFKFANDWIYMESSNNLAKIRTDVVKFTICVTSKLFHPTKYKSFLSALLHQYNTLNEPTKLMEAYLSVCTVGKYSNLFIASDFKEDASLGLETCIKDMIEIFGVEAVILWNAVMLKRRVIILAQNVNRLLAVVSELIHILP